MKQVTEPTPKGFPQRNWKEKLNQPSIAISEKGVCTMLLTNHDVSSPRQKQGDSQSQK